MARTTSAIRPPLNAQASRWSRGQPLTCTDQEIQRPVSQQRRATGHALRGPAVLRSIVRPAVRALPSTSECDGGMDHLDQRGDRRCGWRPGSSESALEFGVTSELTFEITAIVS